MIDWIIQKFGHWLLSNAPTKRAYLCDFKQICNKIQPGDVLLIEGRNRISGIIKEITQSPWSHAALYIGNIHEIQNSPLKKLISTYTQQHALSIKTLSGHLLIETDIGVGTTVSLIEKYQEDHIRILRPHGIFPEDIQNVIAYMISHLGSHYDLRHVFDLARFLLPWRFFPRKWRSSLFEHNALKPTREICSSLIAEAFQSVGFPVLPFVVETEGKPLELVQRNSKLFTPSDFDYSPYFDVIKYPIFPLGIEMSYKNLPWKKGDFNKSDYLQISKD